MNRLRGWARSVAGAAAALAGHSVRIAHRVGLPGLVGAGLVSYGTALIFLPAGIIMAGVFLLLLDWRL